MGFRFQTRLLPVLAASLLVHPGVATSAIHSSLDGRVLGVLLCDRPDGCPKETRAAAAWSASHGLPLVDFDAVGAAGPAGLDARERYLEAHARFRERPGPDSARALRKALKELPFTVPADELFEVWIRMGAAWADAGQGGEADEALTTAASISAGRVANLPPLSETALHRYFDAVDKVSTLPPGTLRLQSASSGVTLYVDGGLVGLAPQVVSVAPGLHRVSAERPSRRSAWVGEIRVVPGGTMSAQIELSLDDSPASLEAVVLGQLRGVAAPSDAVGALVAWARARELRWVRFLSLYPAAAADLAGNTAIPDPDPNVGWWGVLSSWIDVERGVFDAEGPSPAELRDARATPRFRVGAGVGYRHLAPRHHGALDLRVLHRLGGSLDLDVRLGVIRTGDPYYLYEGWIEPQLFPFSAGLRWGSTQGGPQAGLSALAVIPYALGGQGTLGWDFAPTVWWRLGIEALGGWTDKGWTAGGGVTLGRAY